MSKINFFTWAFFFSFSASFLVADIECKGGGESGTPFNNITKLFQSETKVIKTNKLVKDFIVRERINELVYRDEGDLVWQASAASHVSVAPMCHSFSRVEDPTNELVLAKGNPWSLNTKSKTWVKVGDVADRGEDLFWQGKRLFSLESQDLSKSIVRYAIHQLEGRTQHLSCSLDLPANTELHAATGHTYPHLFMYTTENLPEGVRVRRFALRLEKKPGLFGEARCHPSSVMEYKDLMPGKVKALHHFGQLENPATNAWLMELEHPSKKMLWSTHTECTYFNAPQGKILLPNPHVPVILMPKVDGGLTLFYPAHEKSVDLLEKTLVSDLTQENLWITESKKDLYVAARPQNEKAAVLLKVSLDGVQ